MILIIGNFSAHQQNCSYCLKQGVESNVLEILINTEL